MNALICPNPTKHEHALACAVEKMFSSLKVDISRSWQADRCPSELLPWLAYTVQAEWNSEWEVETKRKSILNAIAIHREQGTRASLERVLDTLNITADLVEWFQEPEKEQIPHTFRIDLPVNDHDNHLGSQEIISQIKRHVSRAKPVRSRYLLQMLLEHHLNLKVACQLICDKVVTIDFVF